MYDIIVAGGGPAGSMVSRYLAKAGKRVLLCQKDFKFKKPCGGGLRIDAFDEFEIDKSLINKIVNEIVIETRWKTIEFDITHAPLAIVDRITFDESLRQDAKKAGATLLEGKVIDVKIKEKGVNVYINSNGENKTYQATYIIVADGVLSTLRKQLLGEEVPKLLTHYSDISSLPTTKCHFYFDTSLGGIYAWRFPYKSGADIGSFSKDKSKKYIINLFKFLKIDKTEKIKGYNIPSWENPIFYKDRAFYLGDAAGQVLPFTYEGIYYAMSSSKILAEVIIDDINPIEYEKRWNQSYLKKFKTLKKLQTIFLSNNIMIYILMRIIEKPSIKTKVLNLWLDKYKLDIDRKFFIKAIKQL